MNPQGGPALVHVEGDNVAVAGMVFARVDGPHPVLQGTTLLVAGSVIQNFINNSSSSSVELQQ